MCQYACVCVCVCVRVCVQQSVREKQTQIMTCNVSFLYFSVYIYIFSCVLNLSEDLVK